MQNLYRLTVALSVVMIATRVGLSAANAASTALVMRYRYGAARCVQKMAELAPASCEASSWCPAKTWNRHSRYFADSRRHASLAMKFECSTDSLHHRTIAVSLQCCGSMPRTVQPRASAAR